MDDDEEPRYTGLQYCDAHKCLGREAEFMLQLELQANEKGALVTSFPVEIVERTTARVPDVRHFLPIRMPSVLFDLIDDFVTRHAEVPLP